ncbi:MAG: TonB-dependent receptor [Pseudomonadota bacterium]
MSNTRNRGISVAILNTGACLTAIVAASGTAVAQDEENDDVVIVTGTKRPATLQETPIAISVVDGDVLREAEIQDAFDLQSVVPSLEVNQGSTTGNAGFSIRGFGGVPSNAGIEPSVGVFVDGVYRSRASAQLSDLVGIERIEVLRGPQSTLFGKNASVGVVSIVTREPEFETGGDVAFTYGNFNAVRVNGDITGPLTDTLAYRLSGSYNRRDGYAENLETGTDLSNRNRWSVRGQLLFQPTDDFSARLIGDFDRIDEDCCFVTNIISGPTTDGLISLLGDVVREDPFSFETFLNFDPENVIENGGVSLNLDKDFGFASVTSITAYRENTSRTSFDPDTSTADIATSFNDGKSDTFTQEIRITSNDSDLPLDWMIGAFYFDETISFPGEFFYGDDFRTFADAVSGNAFSGVEAALALPPGTFGASGTGPTEERGQDNTSWSIFATADVELTEKLTASFGISYIADEKQAFFRQNNTDVFSSLDFVEIGFGQALAGFGVDPTDPAAVAAFATAQPDLFAGIQAGAQDPATNPLLGLQPFQFLPPFLEFPNTVESGETNDDKVTYSVRLAYDITDAINVYGSYATGFKASSWNLSRDSRPFASDFIPGSAVTNPPPSPIRDAGLAVPNLTTGTRFAGPEETEVFEIGAKISLDGFYLNLALFDQIVEGFQSNVFLGTGFALSNAGQQSSRGVEIDMGWEIIEGLNLVFAGTFLDPEFDDFANSPAGDLTGAQPAGISEVSTSTALSYDFTIAGLDAFVRADWQHSGSTPYTDSQALQSLIGFERQFDLVNATAGIDLSTGTRISVWGRNIFDEQYVTGAFPALVQTGSVSGFVNQPATYGFTIRHSF